MHREISHTDSTFAPQRNLSLYLLTALIGRLPSQEPTRKKFTLESLRLPRDLPVTVPSTLVSQRPDIRAAEANLHAAAAQVGVAIANRLPIFNLSGDAGRMASQFPNLFNPSPAYLFWTLTGSVTQTIFDGFTLEQRQRAAEAGWEQAADMYGSTVVTAFQNVADALQMVALDGDNMRHVGPMTRPSMGHLFLNLNRASLSPKPKRSRTYFFDIHPRDLRPARHEIACV